MRCISILLSSRMWWYPECVGQVAASWLYSPLGTNLLRNIAASSTDKNIIQINNTLNGKETFKSKTGIFYSPKCNNKTKWDELNVTNLHEEEVAFDITDAANVLEQWILKDGNAKPSRIREIIPPDIDFALLYNCDYKNAWEDPGSKGRLMKIHNSFKYTQDVHYEARITEMPLQDKDFRMVVLIPNETDLLNTLFRRLMSEGLAASFASIQPVFSVDSMFRPPEICIKSLVHARLDEDDKMNFLQDLIQFGRITVNGSGVEAKVLSCLFSTGSKIPRPNTKVQKDKAPFFFAITYKDTPIFTGQYVP